MIGYGQELDKFGKCLKYSMFVINFIVFLGGLSVVGLGVWTLQDKSFLSELLGTNLLTGASYILIVTGSVIAIISFLGCRGAQKELKCMLFCYLLVVLILFATMLVGGVLGFVFREKVHTSMEQQMTRSLSQYGRQRAITEAWDSTQSTLDCCGVHNYEDWRSIPSSCCRYVIMPNGTRKQEPCQSVQTVNNIFTEGCLDKAEIFVRDNAQVLASMGVFVAGLMMIGMILAFALFKQIN